MSRISLLVAAHPWGMFQAGDTYQHTISAVALDDTTLIFLSRRALYQLHQQDIALFVMLMLNIARELARRLQFIDHLLVESVHAHEQETAVDKNQW